MKSATTLTAIATTLILAVQSSQAEDELYAQIFDLNFPGGTVETYVEAILDEVSDINIVVTPEASDVSLESFELHRVDLYAAISLLEGLIEKTASRTVKLTTDLTEAWTSEAQDIIVIQAEVQEHTFTAHTTNLVISVNDLLDDGGIESARNSAIHCTRA